MKHPLTIIAQTLAEVVKRGDMDSTVIVSRYVAKMNTYLVYESSRSHPFNLNLFRMACGLPARILRDETYWIETRREDGSSYNEYGDQHFTLQSARENLKYLRKYCPAGAYTIRKA